MKTLKLTNQYDTYTEYKDSGVEWLGEIPRGWAVQYLRGIADENQEKNTKGQNQNLLSLSYGRIVQKDIDHVGGLLPESFNTYQIVHKNNIVLRLTDLQNDKKSLRVGFVKDQSGIITSAYLGLQLHNEVQQKYVYYLLHSYDLQKVFYNLGGGVRQTLNFHNLKYLPITLPDKQTQLSIVAYLDEKTARIDSLIKKKKKLIALLREKRTAVINQAVTKGLDASVELVDSGVEWIGKIPKGWEVKKIKHLVTQIESGVWGDNMENDEHDIRCLRVADFDYQNLSFEDVETVRNNPRISKFKILKAGDILVEKSGGGEKTPVGRAILFDSDEKMTCANFIDIVRVDPETLSSRFLVFYLSTLYSGRINTKYIKQNTGIQNLDIKNYFTENIVFPDVAEQQRIVEFIKEKMSDYDQSIKKVEKSIELLQEFKSSLISHVVTGKVKV